MNIILLVVGVSVVGGIALLQPRLGLYLMVFLTPIQYYLVLVPSGTLIKYIGWIVVFAWIAQKVITKSPIGPWRPVPLLIPIMFFWYICLISFAWSFDTGWKTSIFSYTQLIVWVILILDVVNTQKRLEWLFLSLVLGVLISAFILFYEFLTSVRTWEYSTIAEGGFGDRNTTAASFLYVIPVIFYWIQTKSKLYQLGGICSINLLLIGVGISVSRTGLVILPLLLLLQIRSFRNTGRSTRYLLLVSALVVVSLPFWPWEHIDYRFSRVWTGGLSEDLGGRVGTAHLALDQFMISPVTGRGLGGYLTRYTISAHNLFLEIAAQLGVFGLLAMIWIWIVAWQHLVAAYRQAQDRTEKELCSLIRAVQLSFLVFLVYSLAMSSQTQRLLWLTFALSGVCYNIAHLNSQVLPELRGEIPQTKPQYLP